MKLHSKTLTRWVCCGSALMSSLPAVAAIYRCVGIFANNGLTQTVSYTFGFAGGTPNCECDITPDYMSRAIGGVHALNGEDILIGTNTKVLGTANGTYSWEVSSCFLQVVSS